MREGKEEGEEERMTQGDVMRGAATLAPPLHPAQLLNFGSVPLRQTKMMEMSNGCVKS